jgi:type II secretory pathway component GspD/PulD (secretin)
VVVDINRAPITSKRAVHTTVTVRDGETVVIGGMIKDNTTVTTEKVWLLGDLPLLGALFRHKHRNTKQTDLMIFITPHIVKND